MGGIPRHNSPTGVHSRSPKNSKVGFAGVTGISRPLTNDEHWALYYFEAHAGSCQSCHDPLKVSRSGKKLCDDGHRLAIDVANQIFRRNDGEVYSRTRDGEQEVRVEIPHGYTQTLSLLDAIQRSIRHGERFVKPASHDRTYVVASRLPTEKLKHDRKEEVAKPPAVKSSKIYDTVVVEPASSTRRPRRERESHDTHTDSKRGSLYDFDMSELARAEMRDQKIRYNLEVRLPLSHKSHRRISTYD
jgi:hypothetical protein